MIDLTGGNTFRARAFRTAARSVDQLKEPVTGPINDGTLTDISGIGEGLQAQIEDIIEAGSFDVRDDLLASLPEGLPELLRVKGLGAKKVRKIWQTLDITTLDGLQAAAEEGRIAKLKGFGKKTEANILQQIQLLRTYNTQQRYADVVSHVETLLKRMRRLEGIKRAELAGQLRRKLETIRRADIIVTGAQPDVVVEMLRKEGFADGGVAEAEEVLFEGLLPVGVPLRVHWVPPTRFGTAWWWHTGSKEHRDAFTGEYGTPKHFANEADVYTEAGLDFIPPELREGRGELDAAAAHTLPTLIDEDDLQGTLHNHSTYSDGAHTIREMADGARAMGLSYFGICDHSQSLTVASGLSPERVRAQQQEIAQLNEEYAADDGEDFRIYSGIESDILNDGSLDYPDEVLETFDLVVASIHSGFNMTEEAATNRLIRAVENPYTTILGHTTGRLLLRREGYPVDHTRVINACAENDVVIELNANPRRLDMDWRYLQQALNQGVMISINPDAHSIEELAYVRWGIAVARKGWLTAEKCLNAYSLQEFDAWLNKRRAHRTATIVSSPDTE